MKRFGKIGVLGLVGAVLISLGILAFRPDSAVAKPTYRFTSGAVAVTSTETTLFTYETGGEGNCANIEIANAADGAALTDFKYYERATSSTNGGTWILVYSDTDWTTLAGTEGMPKRADPVPNTLAAGSSTFFVVNLWAAHDFKITATTATSTSVTVRGTVRTVTGHKEF